MRQVRMQRGGYKPENHPCLSVMFQITAPKFTGNPKFAFKPDWDALRTFNSRLESIPVPVAYQSRCMAWNAPIPF